MEFRNASQGKPSRRVHWIMCTAFVLATRTILAQNAPTTGEVKLTPGAATTEIALAPAAVVNCVLDVPAGSTVVLNFREEAGTSAITWTDVAGLMHTPRTNRGGRGALVQFTLSGPEHGLQRFAIQGLGNRRTNQIAITVSNPRPAAPSDVAVMDAEESVAEADLLWSKHDAGNAREALGAYDRSVAAWEKLGDTTMLRRSLTWKGVYLAFTLSDMKGALQPLEQAARLPENGDAVEQANTWKTLGFVQTTLANYPEGWAAYARALDLFVKTGDRFNREVMLENRGKLSQMTGDLAGALNDAMAAMQIARELDDKVGVLHIEDNIGSIYLQRGQLQAAFDAYEDVLVGLEKIDSTDSMIGFVETDLAQLYEELGSPAQARNRIEDAGNFWKTHPYTVGQLSTIVQKGKLDSSTGNLAAARADYELGIKLANSAEMKRELVFCMLGLGGVERETRKYAEAESNFSKAADLAEQIHEYGGLAQIRIAQADLKLIGERADEAAALYRQALDIAERSFDRTQTVAALGGMARAEEKLGNYEEARRHIKQALDGIESTREFIAVESLKTAYFTSQHSYYALAVEVLMRLARLHPDGIYAQEALEVAERARARALLDEISASGSRVKDSADQVLTAQRAAILRDLRLREISLVALGAGQKQSTQIVQLQSQVAELLEQDETIESRIRAQQHTSGDETVLTPDASDVAGTIAELRAHLDPSTELIEYWVGNHASYLWAITDSSIQSYTLPDVSVLNRAAEQMNSSILAPHGGVPASMEQLAAQVQKSREQFAGASRRLAQILLPSGAIAKNINTLLVVGDGPLLSIPFQALEWGSSSGGSYLMDRLRIVQEPSIGVLANLLHRKNEAAATKVAIIADPVYSEDDPRLTSSGNSPGGRAQGSTKMQEAASELSHPDEFSSNARLERLSHARKEADDIAMVAGPGASTFLLGFDAAPDQIKDFQWSGYAIAHFATHAWMNPYHPELAGVALSQFDREGRRQQGVLWFSDIAAMHMPLQLVTLSACQTANGQPMPGEGLVGLSYSFFLAGAERVVGSLWRVDDDATASLMRAFYAALLGNRVSPAEALRTAQRKLAKTAGWSDPYYWAGFNIEGDWRPLAR